MDEGQARRSDFFVKKREGREKKEKKTGSNKGKVHGLTRTKRKRTKPWQIKLESQKETKNKMVKRNGQTKWHTKELERGRNSGNGELQGQGHAEAKKAAHRQRGDCLRHGGELKTQGVTRVSSASNGADGKRLVGKSNRMPSHGKSLQKKIRAGRKNFTALRNMKDTGAVGRPGTRKNPLVGVMTGRSWFINT